MLILGKKMLASRPDKQGRISYTHSIDRFAHITAHDCRPAGGQFLVNLYVSNNGVSFSSACGANGADDAEVIARFEERYRALVKRLSKLI